MQELFLDLPVLGSASDSVVPVQWEPCFLVSIRFWHFLQRFLPRLLDGFCIGYIFRFMRKKTNIYVSCAVTGFFSAFLNTLFFMTALIGMFGNTSYIKEMIGGQNVILFCCAFVGINAVCEMVSSTVITGAVGAALSRAHLLPAAQAIPAK